ncbi:MAG: hypothetical protein A2033_09160 [Bacteroidetes bacterium GWA2_31_9]|nr:MAG: hypothetical protein A2033_09160 [Bacteroidetes bacterium GWA2_31_9]
MTVTFVEQPEPVMPAYATICGLDDTIIVRNVKGYGNWTTDPPGSAIFGNWLNYTTSVSVADYDTITFVWHETLGGCSTTDTMIVNFNAVPNATIDLSLTPNQTCGCSTTLYANLQGTDYPGFWDSNIPGATFSNVDSNITTINIPCNSSTFGTESYKDVNVIWRQYNGNCTDNSSHAIRFFQMPTPFAGNDTISCSLIDTLDGRWSLGDGIGDATGKWINLSTNSVTFIPAAANIANTVVQASQPGIYQFMWRETNILSPSCINSDTVVVEFIVRPTFSAGLDTTVCGQEVCLTATPATNPASDIVSWIPLQNTGGITYTPEDTDPHACALYGDTGRVMFRWRETVLPEYPILLTNGYSCYYEDTMYVRFVQEPFAEHLVPDYDSVVCGTEYLFYGKLSSIVGATYNLVDNIDSTSITPNNLGPNIFNIQIADTSYGLHEFYYVVYNEACNDSIDLPVIINFYERPHPDAGAILDTACGKRFGLEATSLIQGSSVSWSAIGSDVTFYSTGTTVGNSTIDTAIVIYLPQDREIVLTESVGPNDLSCTGTDNINIKFRAIPFGDFTFTEPKCFGDTFSLAAVDNTQPLFTWTESFDILNYGSSPNLNWAWTNGDSIHNVTLVSTNIWECPSIPVTKQLNEPPIIKIDFDVDDTECNYNNGSLTANATGGLFKPNGYFTYEWGSPITTNINNQLQDSIYSGQYIVSVTDSWDCMVFDTVYVENFGLVTANFETTNFETSYNAPATISFNNMSIDATTYKWYFNNTNTQGVYVDIKTIYTDSPWNPWFTFNPKIQFPGGAVIDSTNSNPSFTYEDGGDFWIFLIAISEYGCADTMYYEKIHVEYRPSIEAPNVFTPNGDGINDFFKIKVKSLESFQGVIFNRWGHKVYEFNDPEDAGWDGKVNGGSLASPGTYYYMIEGVGKDGTEFSPRTDNCETCKGFLQLIRD